MEAARRYAERADGSGRHRAHPSSRLSAQMLSEFDQPMGIGPVIEVDTTAPVDMAQLVTRVRTVL
ncbi:MAG: hypothetical protein ACYDEA_02620 [Candidatus Dormibacteria bacterium]